MKVLKIISLHIFAISSDKRGDEVDFFPADKQKSFLQVDSITLGWMFRHARVQTSSLQFVICNYVLVISKWPFALFSKITYG